MRNLNITTNTCFDDLKGEELIDFLYLLDGGVEDYQDVQNTSREEEIIQPSASNIQKTSKRKSTAQKTELLLEDNILKKLEIRALFYQEQIKKTEEILKRNLVLEEENFALPYLRKQQTIISDKIDKLKLQNPKKMLRFEDIQQYELNTNNQGASTTSDAYASSSEKNYGSSSLSTSVSQKLNHQDYITELGNIQYKGAFFPTISNFSYKDNSFVVTLDTLFE